MRIEIVAFTRRGEETGARLRDAFAAQGEDAGLARCGAGLRVGDWTRERFRTGNALVFIGAAGIAVRAVAPHLVSKTSDPAVVVLNDAGRHVVPILSGHTGGANALARRIAAILGAGAEAVITTATDGNGVFSVDEWARRIGYGVANPEAIKPVSAALLDGQEIVCRCDFPVAGNFPEGVLAGESDPGLVVSVFQPEKTNAGALWIVPPVVVLGVGCRRGTSLERLEEFFARFCREAGLSPLAVCSVASIDRKADETGLLEFCRAHGRELATFSADELNAVQGDFSPSAFVRSVTGVDSVAERAAVRGCGGDGTLCVPKSGGGGIVMAAAVKSIRIDFAEQGEA